MLLTLCGLNFPENHQGGLGLGGSVHQESHPWLPILLKHPLRLLILDASTLFIHLI